MVFTLSTPAIKNKPSFGSNVAQEWHQDENDFLVLTVVATEGVCPRLTGTWVGKIPLRDNDEKLNVKCLPVKFVVGNQPRDGDGDGDVAQDRTVAQDRGAWRVDPTGTVTPKIPHWKLRGAEHRKPPEFLADDITSDWFEKLNPKAPPAEFASDVEAMQGVMTTPAEFASDVEAMQGVMTKVSEEVPPVQWDMCHCHNWEEQGALSQFALAVDPSAFPRQLPAVCPKEPTPVLRKQRWLDQHPKLDNYKLLQTQGALPQKFNEFVRTMMMTDGQDPLKVSELKGTFPYTWLPSAPGWVLLVHNPSVVHAGPQIVAPNTDGSAAARRWLVTDQQGPYMDD